jgi:hypothetical protein
MKTSIKFLVLLYWITTLSSCVDLPCIHEKAVLSNREHITVNIGATIKDPPAIFIKRCHVHGCHSRRIHCHANSKFRGSPWWKNQNPKSDENLKLIHV